MGLNPELYNHLNPDMGHPSEADIDHLFSIAMTDSPWLQDWQGLGGFANHLWASGLEHLVYENKTLDQTCAVGVSVLDQFGWRGSGILNACGHTVEIKTFDQYYTVYYMNNFPFQCQKCKKILESMN